MENNHTKVKKVLANPQMVSDVYTHAILAQYPKQRYLVGNDAWLIFSWLPLLPSWASDIILNILSPPVLPTFARNKK